MSAKWLGGVTGAALVVSSLVIAAFLMLERRSGVDGLMERIDATKEDVAAAHQLWEADQRFEAINRYKAILRTDERIHLRDDLPVLYRRIIEHEVEYGDPGDARDWCLRAYDEWPGMPMRLTFGSSRATEVWEEVTAAARERRSSW